MTDKLSKAVFNEDNRSQSNAKTMQKKVLTSKPQARANKRQIAAYFDPAAAKQLRMLAVENDTTIQALMSEALNELFKKYKKPNIA